VATAAESSITVPQVVALTGTIQQRISAWLRRYKAEHTPAGWPVSLVHRVLAEHGATVPLERLLAGATPVSTRRPARPARPANRRDVLALLSAEQERHERAEQLAREQAIEAARWQERARRLEAELARQRVGAVAHRAAYPC
jgi:hypothetical protein